MGKRRESLGEWYESCDNSSYNCSSYADFTEVLNYVSQWFPHMAGHCVFRISVFKKFDTIAPDFLTEGADVPPPPAIARPSSNPSLTSSMIDYDKVQPLYSLYTRQPIMRVEF